KRILSRNHPEVDGGWLCDKGRFTHSHLNARDRITSPLRRVRRRGFEEISWDDALDEAEAMLRRAGNRIVTALSGSETVELAYGRGAADGWAAASDEEADNPEPIGLLIVSGDEAAADPSVRALAEHAEAVLASTMFQGLALGWADLVLPGTSYLERDGTYINLEGRVQRLRRAVIAPGPDELAWIARLAQRFGVELSPYPSVVFDELSARLYGGVDYVQVAEHAPLPP